jgi:hypothetical protein
MKTKTGAELSAILATIKLNDDNDPNANGIPADLWGCMPDQASGQLWAAYIANIALEVEDILAPEGEYTFDDLTEAVMEYADNSVPAYYYEQFKEIADLGLWAIDEIEEAAGHYLGAENPLNLREMMPLYCAAAYQVTYLAVCNYIMGEEDAE